MEVSWLLGSTRLSDKAIKTFSTLSQRTGQLQPWDCINLSIMMCSSLVFPIYFYFFCVVSALFLGLVREMKTNLCFIGPPWTEKVYSREEWMRGEARKMDLLKLHLTMVVRKESRERLRNPAHLQFIISRRRLTALNFLHLFFLVNLSISPRF